MCRWRANVCFILFCWNIWCSNLLWWGCSVCSPAPLLRKIDLSWRGRGGGGGQGYASENFDYWPRCFLFSSRELRWMSMTSSECIHYSWTRLAPASFLKNTKQNSCSTKTSHPNPDLKPWRLRPGMIDEFPIPVCIACSMLFVDLSITCAALANVCKQTENHFSLLLVTLNSLSVK